MKFYLDLIRAVRNLPPHKREQARQLANEALVGQIHEFIHRLKSWHSAFIDRIRIHLIKLLAGKNSVLINVKIVGCGNSIKMSDPALIMNVSLDASEPAADSIIEVSPISDLLYMPGADEIDFNPPRHAS